MTARAAQVDVDVLDRPLDRAAAAELCRSLAREDPVAAQQALCDALASPLPAGETDAGRFATLVALDATARRICAQLLDRYVDRDGGPRSLERAIFVAASRLSQSMAVAYDRLLARAREADAVDRSEYAAGLVVRLLAFRQIEYVLRMFRYKRRNGNQWRALNDLYRFAAERGLQRHAVAAIGSERVPGTETTIEQHYIRILLLEAANSGQLSPRETLWSCRWFARWSRSLALSPEPIGSGTSGGQTGFAVDLAGAEGPTRKTIEAGTGVVYLDTAPLAAVIDEARKAVLESNSASDATTESKRHAELALLDKLRVVLAPVPAHIERRGQRTPIAAIVHTTTGLPHIVHLLRRSASGVAAKGSPAAPLAEPTIEAYGGPTRTQTLVVWNAADFARGTIPEAWQLRDRSDSGCRMRGKTGDLNRVVPGSLLAFRANEAAPWTLAVVRRLRRLMVDYVEIGTEYVGRKPRFVKIVTDDAVDPRSAARQADPKCIGALYLPPSEEYPAMPIRTLVLPARDFRSDRDVTLLSSDATYTLRMNQPIRCEVDFVWTSFIVVEKRGAERLASRNQRP